MLRIRRACQHRPHGSSPRMKAWTSACALSTAHGQVFRAISRSERLATIVCLILILCVAMTFTGSVVAETPPSGAPISRADMQRISRAIRGVTKKPILMIANVLEDSYVPGAITGNAYEVDTNTSKRTPQYIRTDLVSVYMGYADRSHVDVYTVRKVGGRWKIESKQGWFL